jgi:hypothetical protein
MPSKVLAPRITQPLIANSEGARGTSVAVQVDDWQALDRVIEAVVK